MFLRVNFTYRFPQEPPKILRFAPSLLRHSLANLVDFEKKGFDAARQFFFEFINFYLFGAFFTFASLLYIASAFDGLAQLVALAFHVSNRWLNFVFYPSG